MGAELPRGTSSFDRLQVPAHCIPSDHARQSSAEQMTRDYLAGGARVAAVLDLGCGNGDSVEFFRSVTPQARWVGVDIADSVEVQARTRKDAEFVVYDGRHVPLADASVDLVFCKQVLMYVEDAPIWLREVTRVLTPQGRLIGSISQMESPLPGMRRLLTPFGLFTVLSRAGLELEILRPGIDGHTLLLRRFRGTRFLNRYLTRESPFNRLVDLVGKMRRRDPAHVNVRKLMFAGHLCFQARRAS